MATCDTCERYFPSGWHAAEQHADARGHVVRTWECDCCSDSFYNPEACQDHEAKEHHWCSECQRGFSNWNNMKQHLRSRRHLGTTIDCPFCRESFATATGLTHHVERGSCPKASFLNRDEVYRILRQRDPSGVITKNLIGWHGSPTFTATNKTWNSDRGGFECYFCNRLFNHLQSLNQHLQSPAHQQNLYHCPNRSCGREFTTLAAVMNHLESESCQFMRFSAVQTNIQKILDSNRMLTF